MVRLYLKKDFVVNGAFSVEDKERSEKPNVYEDEKVEQYSWQIQE